MRNQVSIARSSRDFRVRPHRAFDPAAVGRLECGAWVAYYRRDWLAFARSAVTLSRRVFGLSWPATVYCSWLVLRATQRWAPTHENDPERAQRAMERFYRIAQRRYGESFDPARAAVLEVEWWRIHRANQRLGVVGDDQALTDALARLYAHTYGVPHDSVRHAAEQRARAMRHSDRWIREGCRDDSPLIDQICATLIGSYTALLGAVAERFGPGERPARAQIDARSHTLRYSSTKAIQTIDRDLAEGYRWRTPVDPQSKEGRPWKSCIPSSPLALKLGRGR